MNATFKIVLAMLLVISSTVAPYAASATVPDKTSADCGAVVGTILAAMKQQSGQNVDHERLIGVEDLPAAVYAALLSFGDDIRVDQVEENIDAGHATYEIDVLQDDVYYEVVLDAQGTLIADEIEAWIVPLGSLSEPARNAIETEALGGVIILELRKEPEKGGGGAVYEALLQTHARTYWFTIDENGGFIERDITLAILPPGAYQAISCAAHGGSIVELDEEMNAGQLSYEANILWGNVEFEISVDESGNVVELNF